MQLQTLLVCLCQLCACVSIIFLWPQQRKGRLLSRVLAWELVNRQPPLTTSTISVPLEQHKPPCSSTYSSSQNQFFSGSHAKALPRGQQPGRAVTGAAEWHEFPGVGGSQPAQALIWHCRGALAPSCMLSLNPFSQNTTSGELLSTHA